MEKYGKFIRVAIVRGWVWLMLEKSDFIAKMWGKPEITFLYFAVSDNWLESWKMTAQKASKSPGQ